MSKRERMEAEDLFSSLPEGCISHILSFTSPRDACRCSAVCKVFRSALESDMVWERFLPSDYPEILARSVRPIASESDMVWERSLPSDYPEILARSVRPVEFTSKKELFFRLCDSILIDDGQISFSMEKMTCRKGYMFSARKFGICWGETPRYWIWSPHPQSRFSEVAELLTVCWLEIEGKIGSHILSPKTTYKVFLVLKFSENTHGLDHIYADTLVKLGCQEFKGIVSLRPNNATRSEFDLWHRVLPETSRNDVHAPEARSQK